MGCFDITLWSIDPSFCGQTDTRRPSPLKRSYEDSLWIKSQNVLFALIFPDTCWTTLTTAMAASLWWTHPGVYIYTGLSVSCGAPRLWWCCRVTLVDYIILGGCCQCFGCRWGLVELKCSQWGLGWLFGVGIMDSRQTYSTSMWLSWICNYS